jgi:hypothetical protein
MAKSANRTAVVVRAKRARGAPEMPDREAGRPQPATAPSRSTLPGDTPERGTASAIAHELGGDPEAGDRGRGPAKPPRPRGREPIAEQNRTSSEE